jgi:hypothetical protein
MEHRWNEIDREKTEVLGEKPVPVPLGLPEIPHGLTPGSKPSLCGGRPATNRLSHGTALYLHINGKHKKVYCGSSNLGKWRMGEQTAVEIEVSEQTK